MTPLFFRPALWGGVALFGFLLSTLALLSLHFLRRDYSPEHNFLSEYAVGPYGPLMTAVFIMLGLSILALLAGIGSVQNAPSHRLFLFALLTGAAGLLVMAFCRTDLNDLSPRTRIGSLHDSVSVITFFCILIAMAIYGWKLPLPIASPLQRLQLSTRLLTSACSCMLVIQLFLVGHRPYRWVGLPERILVVLFLLWGCGLSLCLISLPDTGKSR